MGKKEYFSFSCFQNVNWHFEINTGINFKTFQLHPKFATTFLRRCKSQAVRLIEKALRCNIFFLQEHNGREFEAIQCKSAVMQELHLEILFSRNERVLGIRFIFTLHVLLTGLLWPGEDEKEGCTRSSLMIKDTGDAKIALAPQKLMFFDLSQEAL